MTWPYAQAEREITAIGETSRVDYAPVGTTYCISPSQAPVSNRKLSPDQHTIQDNKVFDFASELLDKFNTVFVDYEFGDTFFQQFTFNKIPQNNSHTELFIMYWSKIMQGRRDISYIYHMYI